MRRIWPRSNFLKNALPLNWRKYIFRTIEQKRCARRHSNWTTNFKGKYHSGKTDFTERQTQPIKLASGRRGLLNAFLVSSIMKKVYWLCDLPVYSITYFSASVKVCIRCKPNILLWGNILDSKYICRRIVNVLFNIFRCAGSKQIWWWEALSL